MTATAQVNELESWYASLPGIVQEVLHEPYVWMDDKLKMVAGDPQALMDAGARYAAMGQAVTQLAQQNRSDVDALAPVWSGRAYDAFSDNQRDLESTLQALEKQLAAMPQLLEQGAQACVEGANMIVEIVVALIALALGTLAVNAALSVITFGASLAAAAAEVLAEAAVAVARVAQVVEKVAQVLVKIAEVLQKIAKVLRAIAEFFRATKETLAAAKAATKGAKGMEWVGAKSSFIVQKAIASKEIWAVTGGQVKIPGVAGPLYHAGKDYTGAWGSADDAVATADAATD